MRIEFTSQEIQEEKNMKSFQREKDFRADYIEYAEEWDIVKYEVYFPFDVIAHGTYDVLLTGDNHLFSGPHAVKFYVELELGLRQRGIENLSASEILFSPWKSWEISYLEEGAPFQSDPPLCSGLRSTKIKSQKGVQPEVK